MQLDIFIDDLVTHSVWFEVTKSTNKNSTMWIARAGKISVSIEILKPKRHTNHERPTESRGRT